MAQKHMPEEIVRKLRQGEQPIAAGKSIAAAQIPQLPDIVPCGQRNPYADRACH